ncbi:histidine kinase [Streptomyces varsoviensis]|uniref:sensor histidine kinase n=1 Tax=Streptomyces varsoviensis TaxID=67373 RepID=UPI0033D5C813
MTIGAVEGAGPPPDGEPGGRHDVSRLAPRLTKTVVSVVVCGLGLVALLNTMAAGPGVGGVFLALGCMGVLLFFQLAYFTRSAILLTSRWRIPIFLLKAVCAFAPLFVFHQTWVGMPGFIAGDALLVLDSTWCWTLFTGVVVAMGGMQWSFTPDLPDTAYTAISTALTGLIVYGLIRLTDMVAEVHRTRTALAEMAVAQERLRFARDLHDLLGYSLSAISLKSELTRRLIGHDDARAVAEVSDIIEISRQALADVRDVASQYRDLSLVAETRSARSVLDAAGIEVSMAVVHGSLPDRVGTVLATVLREGVTNVLGHSKAEHCEITIRQESGTVLITIVNDGAQPEPAALPARHGLGLASLTTRVEALGGRLTAGLTDPVHFRLQAEIPLHKPMFPKQQASEGHRRIAQ